MKKKILTLLVLLMTAVTGAWAQEETLLTTILSTGDNASFTSDSQTFDNIATVTFSGEVYNDDDEAGWFSIEERTLTVTAAEGYTITRVKFYTDSESAFDEEAPFEAILVGDDNYGSIAKVNGTSIGAWGVTKIEVYGYADTPAAAEPITVYFTDAKGWGDVKVYYWPNGTAWPGNAMTYVEDNEYNQKVYKAQVPANVEGIVFNGNGKQTVNITENIANNAWWYSDAEGGDGKFTVGYVGKYLAVEPTQNPNEWTLAQMPACDLELEVEYYPLATLATLPAAAEGLNDATTADLLTPGTSNEGTLYYALGTSEAPTGQWSQTIPTTEGLEAGEYYVWYKVVGDAEHSDSQPQSIAVTVAALPTYAVTIDDASVDASKWQATPAEQRAGQTVTLSYTGKKKVKNITIEKAAAAAPAEGHPLSASEVGEIVCSDGLAYAAADKDNLPTGVTAVAIVAYVGDAGSVDASSSTYKGLAIAMSNANGGSSCGWGDYFTSYNCVSKSNDIATAIGYKDGISSTITLTSDGHYHEAATAAASNNGTAAPTGTSGWFLPSMGQWNLIVQGLASKKAGSAVTTDISTSGNDTYTASNLNSVITDAGGTGFNGDYQSSTQYDSESCWHMNISSGRASDYYFYAGDYVRSVLAF